MRLSAIVAGLVAVGAIVGPAVSAQDDGDATPDLSSGWVVRVATPEGDPVWPDAGPGPLAGNSRLGFVSARDENGLYSRDGVTWQPFTLETSGVDDVLVHDVAAGPRGFVAIGAAGSGEPPFVWHSRDGRAWKRIDPAELPAPADPEIPDGILSQVAAGPDGFVVTGVSRCAQFAWFSSDGRTWTESTLPEECGEIVVTSTDSAGWLAVARVGSARVVLTSGDGRTWSEVDADAPTDDGWLNSLSGRGRTFVVSGGAVAGDGWPSVWGSTDGGTTWTETVFEAGDGSTVGLFPLTVNDLGFVGSFFLESREGLSPGGLVFSPDGSSWREFPADDVIFDLAASQDSIVATSPRGILSWTPPGSELAATGSRDPAAMVAVASGVVTIGAALLLARHLLPWVSRLPGRSR